MQSLGFLSHSCLMASGTRTWSWCITTTFYGGVVGHPLLCVQRPECYFDHTPKPRKQTLEDPILAAASNVSKCQECYYDPTPKPRNPKASHCFTCVQVMWLFCVCVCKWCACRLLKGSPLRWHLQGIFLDLCGPLIICATEVPYPNP